MTNPLESQGRIHALDGLRATMMLLGVVLHSAASYTVIDLGAAWPFKDSARTFIADSTVMFIHTFRMPIFFVLAGFFSALLYQRKGVGDFVTNRAQRIALPFAVGLVVLVPLTRAGFVFAGKSSTASIRDALNEVYAMTQTRDLCLPVSTIHLWFLYYLLYFYLFAIIIAKTCNRMPGHWFATNQRHFNAAIARPVLRVIFLGLATAVTLLPMWGGIVTSTSLLPDPRLLLFYGLFFGFGWLLFRQHEALTTFSQFAWLQAAIAMFLYFAIESIVMPRIWGSENLKLIVGVRSLTGGIVIWLLFFGVTGLYLRYLGAPSTRTRYVVDASYWVYLVHVPCAIWLAGLLVGTKLSVWSRMLVVLVGTALVGFGSYDLVVRSTFIGRILNGRRYPRALPAVSASIRRRTSRERRGRDGSVENRGAS